MVSKIRNLHKEHIPIEKRGRPSKVSKKTKVLLARHFSCGKLESLRQGQQLVQLIHGVQVHRETIRNYLNQEGYKVYVKHKKRDLTRDQKLARFNFARDHLNWTIEQWRNVMFSDETLFYRIGSSGRGFYYKRPEDKSIKEHHIKKLNKAATVNLCSGVASPIMA